MRGYTVITVGLRWDCMFCFNDAGLTQCGETGSKTVRSRTKKAFLIHIIPASWAHSTQGHSFKGVSFAVFLTPWGSMHACDHGRFLCLQFWKRNHGRFLCLQFWKRTCRCEWVVRPPQCIITGSSILRCAWSSSRLLRRCGSSDGPVVAKNYL